MMLTKIFVVLLAIKDDGFLNDLIRITDDSKRPRVSI